MTLFSFLHCTTLDSAIISILTKNPLTSRRSNINFVSCDGNKWRNVNLWWTVMKFTSLHPVNTVTDAKAAIHNPFARRNLIAPLYRPHAQNLLSLLMIIRGYFYHHFSHFVCRNTYCAVRRIRQWMYLSWWLVLRREDECWRIRKSCLPATGRGRVYLKKKLSTPLPPPSTVTFITTFISNPIIIFIFVI